jgi:hypothetical protein
VLEDRAEDRYHRRQLTTKAIVFGEGSPTLPVASLFKRLPPSSEEPPSETSVDDEDDADDAGVSGPLTAAIPRDCLAFDMIDIN